jgi:hypothetical protein
MALDGAALMGWGKGVGLVLVLVLVLDFACTILRAFGRGFFGVGVFAAWGRKRGGKPREEICRQALWGMLGCR